jgi:transcriptional regulator with XRE-family HTH domain
MEVVPMSVGQRIKELRQSLGYSGQEFADLLGIHISSMYRYEETNLKEKRDIPLSVAIAIAEKLGISLDWLAGLSDEMYRKKTDTALDGLSEEGRKEVLRYAEFIKGKEGGNAR